MTESHLSRTTHAVFYTAIIAATLSIAHIISALGAALFTPASPPLVMPVLSKNTKAYISICQALKAGRFSEVKGFSDSAYAASDDNDIRQLSDFLSRQASLMMTAGSQTKEQAGTISGLAKALLTGFVNPAASMEGLSQTIDNLTTDWSGIYKRINARYQPLISSYNKEVEAYNKLRLINNKSPSSLLYFLTIIGCVYAFFHFRRVLESIVLPRIRRIIETAISNS